MLFLGAIIAGAVLAGAPAHAQTTGSIGRTDVAKVMVKDQASPVSRPDKPMREATGAQESFPDFVQKLWPLAKARGVTRKTFDEAFRNVAPDASIAALTRKQAEFVKPIWSYVEGAVTAQRIARGREVAAEWGQTLAKVEKTYGVPKEIVLGVWGMETNFGAFSGNKDVVTSLATLAHLRYRGSFFRDELITALIILQQGHVTREAMRGSWAGAMGHTQFMPSSFMKHAVDFTGDGKKDIWGSIPDALASTANYLRHSGWNSKLPWGFEVTVPSGLDYRVIARDFSAWARAGLKRADGAAMPRHGEATLFMPAGADGPIFLVSANFAVIKKYNSSDAYALGVAHLGDRVMGRPAFAAAWPKDAPQLSKRQHETMQRRLKTLGFYNSDIDGRLGSMMREAVRQYQLSHGLSPADGYPTPRLFEHLASK